MVALLLVSPGSELGCTLWSFHYGVSLSVFLEKSLNLVLNNKAGKVFLLLTNGNHLQATGRGAPHTINHSLCIPRVRMIFP